jgi:hypothetical protein
MENLQPDTKLAGTIFLCTAKYEISGAVGYFKLSLSWSLECLMTRKTCFGNDGLCASTSLVEFDL